MRPEDVDILPHNDSGNGVTGVVKSVLFMGVHYEITVRAGDFLWTVHTTDFVEVGETVFIEILPDAIHIMKKTERAMK